MAIASNTPCDSGSVEAEALLGIVPGQAEERILQRIAVQETDVELNQVGDIQEDLVQPQALNLLVPRVRSQDAIQLLGDISERRQVLAISEDQIRAKPLGIRDELQLLDAAPPGLVVACRQDALLLDAKRERPERGLGILNNLCVEAVVILTGVSAASCGGRSYACGSSRNAG